ncbi:MAG TPA: S9 family peptidase [Terracidiphilus sp.]|jgi:dipeptidyl aminopeptidase/acylaminoacyl peptidase
MNVSRTLLCIALSAVLIAPAIAQTKRPMTFEDMMAMKRLGETAVSLDGKWLAYSVTSVDLEKNSKTAELWLQQISGGDPIKLAETQPGDGGPQFSSDNKHILFASSRDGSQQIWTADFDPATGAASNPKKLTTISTEADNAQWSPDGHFVVFTSSVYPDCAPITFDSTEGEKCNADRDKAAADSQVKAQIFTALLYRHWNHFTGPKRSHLFLVEVATGKVRDLTPNDPHDVPPFSLGGGGSFSISPDSKELAFTENPDPVPAISVSAQIWTLDLTNPAAKPVKISTSAGGNFNPAYSPDGKYLAWRSEARPGYESDKFRIALFDRSQKSLEDMLPKFDNWVDEIAWAPSSEALFFTSGNKGEESIYALVLYKGTDVYKNAWKLETLPKDVLGKSGDLTPFYVPSEFGDLHPTANGKTLLASRMTVRSPQEIVAIEVDGLEHSACTCDEISPSVVSRTSALTQVTHLNDTLLSQLDLPKMQDFWFTAKDGTKLQGFVIPPPGYDPQKKYPVKFLIHGGPQGAWGDSWSYRWNAELFAANGYVVVMINPRGSTGYGQAVVDGVNGDWGGKPFSDLMLGLDYAEQHYPFIDKNRECALGASYGGYMANWVLGHTTRFKCIVSHDGMFNAESAFGSTEEDWFNTWEFKGHPWDYYGKPDAENPFRKWSPSLYAKNFKTPTLVIHGQLDYRLDVSEGYQLFDTLQLMGVPSQMLYFPDEGHWVLKPQNSQLWYKTVNAWVDKWTARK